MLLYGMQGSALREAKPQNNEKPTYPDETATPAPHHSKPPALPHKLGRTRYNARLGSVAERFKAPVLKTGDGASHP